MVISHKVLHPKTSYQVPMYNTISYSDASSFRYCGIHTYSIFVIISRFHTLVNNLANLSLWSEKYTKINEAYHGTLLVLIWMVLSISIGWSVTRCDSVSFQRCLHIKEAFSPFLSASFSLLSVSCTFLCVCNCYQTLSIYVIFNQCCVTHYIVVAWCIVILIMTRSVWIKFIHLTDSRFWRIGENMKE